MSYKLYITLGLADAECRDKSVPSTVPRYHYALDYRIITTSTTALLYYYYYKLVLLLYSLINHECY